MRFHNAVRCVCAAMFVLFTVNMAHGGHVTPVQPANLTREEAPSPAAAVAAYRVVDAWVRGWEVPAAAPEVNGLGSLGGVHVQLRLDGELIGRGQAMVQPGQGAGATLWEAAGRAIDEARPRLVVPNDVNRDAALQEQAGRVMISLDLAGPLLAITPGTWADAELSLSPGLEGVAAGLLGTQGGVVRLTAAFPSFLISTGTLPHRALASVCATAIGEGGAAAVLDQPAAIRSKHSVQMYRFRSTHLAQCRPGEEPVFLYRGARLIDQSEMTAAELRRMAEAMVLHIAATAKRPHGIGRGYSPVTNAFEDGAASSEATALALLALRRYMQPETTGVSPATIAEAKVASKSMCEQLVQHPDGMNGQRETTSFLLALANPLGSESFMPFVACGANVPPGLDPARWQWEREWADGDMFGGVPAAARGVCALAYATAPLLFPLGEEAVRHGRSEVEAAIRGWVSAIPQGQLVAHMPWLGWAEIELAKQKAEARGRHADIPSAIALREMRRQVWEHQVSPLDTDKDSMDMAGGIVFTKGTSPLPTWQSTRPLAFIATMLADTRLTEPQERPLELARLMQSMRFIRQLMADESAGWMAKDFQLSYGGVRAASWDQSMPPDATSMALLVVIEAVRSLESLAAEARIQR